MLRYGSGECDSLSRLYMPNYALQAIAHLIATDQTVALVDLFGDLKPPKFATLCLSHDATLGVHLKLPEVEDVE
jgi:hypothetical protein